MAVPPMPIPGGAIAQVLQQLMRNPAAVQGMQNYMQGKAPTEGMPMPPSQGGPMPGPPPAGGPPMPTGDAPPGDAEQMAQGQIDKAGYTWDGVDAPTKNDIERLVADPSPEAIKSFVEQFGEGMAEKYIEDQGGGEAEPEGPEEEPPPSKKK